MDYNEEERFKAVIDAVTDRLSYIILDIVNLSLDKIKSNLITMVSLENKDDDMPDDQIEF
ncbi:MAG: hypothetical protein GY804_13960 [Alphaproteobacteria bacterium]|nr:hypothetical protein [Alphaproteobacteria bacterium]